MIDARLLLPALAVWAGAAGALVGAVHGAAGVAVTSLVLGFIVRRARRQLIIVAVFLMLGAAAALAMAWRLAPAPLDDWIEQHATATVSGVVTGEPVVRPPGPRGAWWAPGDVRVRARVERIQARGMTVQVNAPVVIRLPLGAEAPPRGASIMATGRLGPLPARTGLAAEVRVPSGAWRLEEEPAALPALATAMRRGLAGALAGVPPDAASIVRGLTLGDEADQAPELREAMRASGLAHLMAVSGGNVSIVVGVVIAVVVLLGAPLTLRVVAGSLAVVYYAYLVGPEPSVLRAAVMGVMALLGVIVGGRRPGPSILGLAVLALLVTMPWLALSWGFALSTAATAGILLVAPVIVERLTSAVPWMPMLVSQALALTVAAQLATLPLLVAMGGAAGWVAVPANLAAMPVVAPVTVLGLMTATIGPMAPGVAELTATAAAWPASWIARVAFTAEAAPGSGWPVGSSWPAGWLGALMVVTALGVVAATLMCRSRVWSTLPCPSRVWHTLPRTGRWGAVILSATLILLIVLRPPGQRGWPPPGWLMIMCDVGQGDGLLLRSGADTAVVVDVGGDPDAMDRCLSDAGIRHVPAVVLTHFHADHVGGLDGVLRGRSIGTVLTSPLLLPRDQSALVDEVVSKAALPLEAITAGDVRQIGDVTWRALWPRRIIRSGSLPNNASVVLVADVRGHPVLLTGDIEPEAQAALLNAVRDVDPEVVKVPHHGSRHQLREFADAVRAPLALVSVGAENEYGHPHVETVAWFVEADGQVLRTDESGDVAVIEDADPPASGTGLAVVVRDGMLPSS